MNQTLRFYAETELADDLETFFKQHGVEFVGGNFIQAADSKNRKKKSGRLVTIANTAIRKISELLLAYMEKTSIELELESEKDSVVLTKQNSVDSIETSIEKRSSFRISLKVKK